MAETGLIPGKTLESEIMNNSVFVLTAHVNEYDQEGDYLITVFKEKPTREQLLKVFYKGSGNNSEYSKKQHAHVGHVLNGGDRKDIERVWYFLRELDFGANYQEIYDHEI